MNKVFLSLNGMDLGYLEEYENGFGFVANENNILQAKEENPIAMMLFNLNKSGTKTYSSIPAPFSRFLIARNRNDLIEKANLSESDSQFQCLYKLAGLDMMEINFKIHQ